MMTTILTQGAVQQLPRRKRGLSASHYNIVLQNLGYGSSLDLLNAMEADRLIFVEGASDADFIQRILNRHSINLNCMYWAFDGLDNLIKDILHCKSFFESIGMGDTLWSKSLLIIDADYMTDQEKTDLEKKLKEKLKIPCKVWSSYTIESTLLNNKKAFSRLLTELFQSKNIPCTCDEVSNRLNQKIQELVDKKLNDLKTNQQYRGSITGQIRNRAKNLDKSLNIKNIFLGNDATYFQDFELFANRELENGRLAHLAEKNDISEIINDIAKHFNTDHYSIWGFGDLIDIPRSKDEDEYEEWLEIQLIVSKGST